MHRDSNSRPSQRQKVSRLPTEPPGRPAITLLFKLLQWRPMIQWPLDSRIHPARKVVSRKGWPHLFILASVDKRVWAIFFFPFWLLASRVGHIIIIIIIISAHKSDLSYPWSQTQASLSIPSLHPVGHILLEYS